jgi:hypothetical protein
MKGMESAVASIREALTERVSTRDRLVKQVTSLNAEIRRLRQAERVLSAPTSKTVASKPKRPKRANGVSANVAAVEAVMRELRTATQSEVAKRIGKPKNTAKAALEQLASRGVVAATGEFDRRSPLFALVDGGS